MSRLTKKLTIAKAIPSSKLPISEERASFFDFRVKSVIRNQKVSSVMNVERN